MANRTYFVSFTTITKQGMSKNMAVVENLHPVIWAEELSRKSKLTVQPQKITVDFYRELIPDEIKQIEAYHQSLIQKSKEVN